MNQLLLQSISLSSTNGYLDQGLVPISAAEKSIVGNLVTVNVTLAIKGTNYESFKSLLSAFENNLRLMDIVQINFSPSAQTTQMNVNVYYSKN